MGKYLIAAGCILIALGLISYIIPLFRLPGDLRYNGEHIKIYIPIASCIVISIILTIIINLFRR